MGNLISNNNFKLVISKKVMGRMIHKLTEELIEDCGDYYQSPWKIKFDHSITGGDPVKLEIENEIWADGLNSILLLVYSTSRDDHCTLKFNFDAKDRLAQIKCTYISDSPIIGLSESSPQQQTLSLRSKSDAEQRSRSIELDKESSPDKSRECINDLILYREFGSETAKTIFHVNKRFHFNTEHRGCVKDVRINHDKLAPFKNKRVYDVTEYGFFNSLEADRERNREKAQEGGKEQDGPSTSAFNSFDVEKSQRKGGVAGAK